MQLCKIIYYFIVPWLLYMFQAILSLNIRSILTVITSIIHVYRCRLVSWMISNSSMTAGAYDWQPYHLHVPIVLNLGASAFWNPQDLSRLVMGLIYLYLTVAYFQHKGMSSTKIYVLVIQRNSTFVIR